MTDDPAAAPRPPHGPRDPGDAWVVAPSGERYWGRFGAAGLLAIDPERGVLLQHRVSWSHFGDTWGLPGGARHAGSPRATERCASRPKRPAFPRTPLLRGSCPCWMSGCGPTAPSWPTSRRPSTQSSAIPRVASSRGFPSTRSSPSRCIPGSRHPGPGCAACSRYARPSSSTSRTWSARSPTAGGAIGPAPPSGCSPRWPRCPTGGWMPRAWSSPRTSGSRAWSPWSRGRPARSPPPRGSSSLAHWLPVTMRSSTRPPPPWPRVSGSAS